MFVYYNKKKKHNTFARYFFVIGESKIKNKNNKLGKKLTERKIKY